MAKLIIGVNDLATVRPELAAEWHPSKNGDLTPSQVTQGSQKRVWWLGSCGHEWQAIVFTRANGCGCPYCAGKMAVLGQTDLATTHPKLASEWHPTKNGDISAEMVTHGSTKKVWWQCDKGHEWQAVVLNRANGRDCPYCAGKMAVLGQTDLATIHPKLASEWHPTKNGDLTPDKVLPGSAKKVWWCGQCGHEWEAVIGNRFYLGSGCPYCSGKKVLSGYNDLATTHPELASEWHPTKNGALTPHDVTYGYGKKVWWKCSICGREWEAQIYSRHKGRGCPECFKHRKKKARSKE